MSEHNARRPGELFNDEDSNRSDNASFDSVLATRLSRRHLLRGQGPIAPSAHAIAAVAAATLLACAVELASVVTG